MDVLAQQRRRFERSLMTAFLQGRHPPPSLVEIGECLSLMNLQVTQIDRLS